MPSCKGSRAGGRSTVKAGALFLKLGARRRALALSSLPSRRVAAGVAEWKGCSAMRKALYGTTALVSIGIGQAQAASALKLGITG
jgi:hypothetical protein